MNPAGWLILGCVLLGVILAFVMPDPLQRARRRKEDAVLTQAQLILRQVQRLLEGQPPLGELDVPRNCHVLWHASDASGVPVGAELDVHLLTFTGRDERVWIDARDTAHVRFLDMDPACYADAAELSDSAVLRIFADYHVDVHYPETREWLRQVMRRSPQGAFVFQVPSENITVGGVCVMRDGELMPLYPGEFERISRILRKAHFKPCHAHDDLSCPTTSDIQATHGTAVLPD